jgi:hypothetical protein
MREIHTKVISKPPKLGVPTQQELSTVRHLWSAGSVLHAVSRGISWFNFPWNYLHSAARERRRMEKSPLL